MFEEIKVTPAAIQLVTDAMARVESASIRAWVERNREAWNRIAQAQLDSPRNVAAKQADGMAAFMVCQAIGL